MAKSPEELYVEGLRDRMPGVIDGGPNPNAKPLEVSGDWGSGERGLDTTPPPKLPKWRCPKCGRTDAEISSLKMWGEALGDMAGDYCFWCYSEWIAQHVPRMVEVAK